MSEPLRELLTFESYDGVGVQMTVAQWEDTHDYFGPGCRRVVAFGSRGGQFNLFIRGPNSPPVDGARPRPAPQG